MMLPTATILIIFLAGMALNGVISIIYGAFRVDRSSELRTKFDERDVIRGLITLGLVVLVVML